MGIRYTTELFLCDKSPVNALYGRDDAFDLFSESFAHVLAYDENTLVGAVRALSEGVETVLIVDLKAVDPNAVSREGGVYDAFVENVTAGLLQELEKGFSGRRVMLYGTKEQLAVLEASGYGRCKNAWTLWRDGFSEPDFLPPGYRFESEFLPGPGADVGAVKHSESAKGDLQNAGSGVSRAELTSPITYPQGRGEATDEEINELLTKAFFGRPHDVKKTALAFAKSRYVGTAYDGEKLVGVARAVADGSRYATILNVAVDPEYQGLSIGKTLLLKLAGRITEEVVVLNTHPGAVGFYNRLKEFRRNRYVFEKHIPDGPEPKRPENPEFRARMFTPAGYRFPDE